ncbi:MAG: hypothetical protein KGH71_04000 [Candidatus Micrarchaeota archaeon]|nr:hypothetical protein [Candidatus Micrarchaeota archaeon]
MQVKSPTQSFVKIFSLLSDNNVYSAAEEIKQNNLDRGEISTLKHLALSMIPRWISEQDVYRIQTLVPILKISNQELFQFQPDVIAVLPKWLKEGEIDRMGIAMDLFDVPQKFRSKLGLIAKESMTQGWLNSGFILRSRKASVELNVEAEVKAQAIATIPHWLKQTDDIFYISQAVLDFGIDKKALAPFRQQIIDEKIPYWLNELEARLPDSSKETGVGRVISAVRTFDLQESEYKHHVIKRLPEWIKKNQKLRISDAVEHLGITQRELLDASAISSRLN